METDKSSTPTLQPYTLESNGSMTPHLPIDTPGNVIDVQFLPGTNTVFVSVDCIREPGSVQEWRPSPPSPSTLLEAYQVKQGHGSETEWESVSSALTSNINAAGTLPVSLPEGAGQKKTALNNSLYVLENLRKKQSDDEGSVF